MKSFDKKGTVHLEDMPGMMVELLEQIKVLGDKIDSMQNAENRKGTPDYIGSGKNAEGGAHHSLQDGQQR